MTTKTIDLHFYDWESHVFGFSYGSGEPHILPALRAFFEACPEDDAYDFEVLEAKLTPAVAWLLINVLNRPGVRALNYGSSPRYGFLTREGKALRTFMLSKTVDQLIEIVTDPPGDDPIITCSPTGCNCGPKGYEPDRVCENPFWPKH